MNEHNQPNPAERAKRLLDYFATVAQRELPAGYTLTLKLARSGESFEGDEIYISQLFEPEAHTPGLPDS